MNPPTRSLALLLDLDGVLVDTEPVALAALLASLVAAGATIDAEALALRFRGKNLDYCSDELHSLLGGPLPADFITTVRSATNTSPAPLAEPGARCLLSEGRPLRVVTNSTFEQAWATLSGAHLDQLLDPAQIISIDQVAHPKPAPDLHTRAIQSLGVPADSCVAVDDSLLGLVAATAAGAHPVGYAPTAIRRAQLGDAGYLTVKHLAAVLDLSQASMMRSKQHVTT